MSSNIRTTGERKTDVAASPKTIDNAAISKLVVGTMDAATCVIVGCTLVSTLLTAILAFRNREHRGAVWYAFVSAAVLSFIAAVAAVFQGLHTAAAEAHSASAVALLRESLDALEQTVLPRNVEQVKTAEAISKFKGIHILLSHSGVKEAEHTAGQIESLAKLAGWTVDARTIYT